MRVSNLFWRLSQESPVGKWEERQGKESSKGHIIKINIAGESGRGEGSPWATHILGLFSPESNPAGYW